MNLTLSANEPFETDLTDQTYPAVTNEQFLATIFTGLPDTQRPFVLGFAGNPHFVVDSAGNQKPRKAWGGSAWLAGKTSTDNDSYNWYFSLAVYEPADDGYHRKEIHCAAVYGVMLDDLGTKALPLARLEACPPSYVIETSAGNFQAGYLFNTAVTDLDAVKGLNQSLVEAALCDSGAKSPATRYGRLPAASNGKSAPAFKCRLVEFHPDRRYPIDEIINRLELAPPKETRKTRTKSAGRNVEDDVYTAKSDENEVISALKTRGLYKSPLGGGRHDITCPWVHEHTDHVDHGSAYFEPSETYPVGGYKCQHGHGDQYKIGKMLSFLAVSFRQAKHKPSIKTEAGELARIVDAAELLLADTKRYYQRGGLIVGVHTEPETNQTSIKPVSLPGLTRALSGAAIWTRYDARADADVVCDPPARHITVLHDSEAYNHLPALAGLARQPHLRADGTLVTEAGFDAATGLFGVFDARKFHVLAKPTKEDALSALAELQELLAEFDFAQDHDRAAALAGFLTAAIRPSLRTAPMFHYKAHQPGTGKSFLSSITASFASPTVPSAISFPTSEDECQKLLLASLLTSPPCVIFDNLTSDLRPFKSLCSALTETHLTGRILGVSKTATVGTRAMFMSSGNNVGATQDMARRVITVSLVSLVESPISRKFKRAPLAVVRAGRERYVSFALTIVRAWVAAGRPVADCTPFASFNQWDAWVRQPLLWLGMADPVTCVTEQLEQDPDRETLGQLLHAWHNTFGSVGTMIRDAVAATNVFGNAELLEVMREVADDRTGEINRRRLGKWIARHKGRIVDGLKFERASGTTSAEKWIAKSVTSVKSVSNRPTAQSVKEKNAPDDDGFGPVDPVDELVEVDL
jgi:hypothetical protein